MYWNYSEMEGVTCEVVFSLKGCYSVSSSGIAWRINLPSYISSC